MEDAIVPSTDDFTRSNPSLAVIERIAQLEGTDPIELTPPLYTAVDPDALDSLFHSATTDEPNPSGRVSFAYRGYDVTVRSDGAVSVSETD